ncbi:glycosyltransferase family 2 protein [Neolewinella antarctica]|uniref:GT2 family glycosyltransferase n=1 Tax=Neolewinella antarctica TaxID=442734 RepID=A0ABX0X829_9BACT|nr:glycosyltransferase family 2 protein [Neolewinella antarctica]NJC25395.1 GT2 family glycosyltransferase [Neolewinella antarctica]
MVNTKTNDEVSARVTVVICTYRRSALLDECLVALLSQRSVATVFDVLVVDNANQHACRVVAEHHGVQYVVELQTGLSHARNKAIATVATEWLFYLDDDALPYPDMMAEFLQAITENPHVRVLGGRYDHYLPPSAPAWLGHHYQTGHRASPAEELTRLNETQHLSGGIFAFRTRLLLDGQGFAINLGMRGHEIGYGEDDEIQDRLRSAGTEIYYSPAIAMRHLVQPRKHTVSAQIGMAHQNGIAYGRIPRNPRFTLADFLREVINITFRVVPYNLARLLFKKSFAWQNATVMTARRYVYAWAKFWGARR